MPIKHNLTKYDKLRDQIHRLSQKKEGEYGVGDELLRSTAVLIAAFASGQSWNTHRALDTRGSFRDPAITNEFRAAESSKWKNINAFDISEVICKDIPHHVFMSWMYYNVECNRHEIYKKAWINLSNTLERLENESTTSVR